MVASQATVAVKNHTKHGVHKNIE